MGNRRTLSGVPSGKRARTMPEKAVPAASAPAPCATAKSGGGEVPVARPGGTKSLPEDQRIPPGRETGCPAGTCGQNTPLPQRFSRHTPHPPLSLKKEPALRNIASPPLPETPGTSRSTTATAKNFNAQFPLHTGLSPPFPPPIRQRKQEFRFRRIFCHTGSYAEKHIDNKLFLMVMFYFSAHRYSAEGAFCPLPVRRKKKKR